MLHPSETAKWEAVLILATLLSATEPAGQAASSAYAVNKSPAVDQKEPIKYVRHVPRILALMCNPRTFC